MRSYTFLALAAFVAFARATTVSLSRRQAECPEAYTGYLCYGEEIILCQNGEPDNNYSGVECNPGYLCWATSDEYGCS
ncbi:hypothetical protein BKA93DRAFT_774843 [Sparassis latifolia]|uniref:Uncharacterized protein n=1 Tax=Sparassis crispa TaxID=139825 RepID=A0A401H332_9APHY|nr:hypothetical protein SCP_1402270 [Sparassis crispa]GBE88821.1 hypothetical protein SCP_1402270 [Sparassis crispa]